MRHFPVETGRSGLDAGMAATQVFQMPVKFNLEFMTVISSHYIDSEWGLSDNVIHEINGIFPGMVFINLQDANADCVLIPGKRY